MISAEALAEHILYRVPKGTTIRNIELQYIMWLLNIDHLRTVGDLLVDELFEETPMGPVMLRVYEKFDLKNDEVESIIHYRPDSCPKEAIDLFTIEYLGYLIEVLKERELPELVEYSGCWYEEDEKFIYEDPSKGKAFDFLKCGVACHTLVSRRHMEASARLPRLFKK